MTITECKELLTNVEEKIINNYKNARSNSFTMYYYCLLGYYRFLGGKESIRKRVVKNGLTAHMPTDKAKYWYEEHADAYSTIAAMYFCLIRAKRKHEDIITSNQYLYGYKVISTFTSEMKRVFINEKKLINDEAYKKIDKMSKDRKTYYNPMIEAVDLMEKFLPEEWYSDVYCPDREDIWDTCIHIAGGNK